MSRWQLHQPVERYCQSLLANMVCVVAVRASSSSNPSNKTVSTSCRLTDWLTEYILNGTSAQLGYTVPLIVRENVWNTETRQKRKDVFSNYGAIWVGCYEKGIIVTLYALAYSKSANRALWVCGIWGEGPATKRFGAFWVLRASSPAVLLWKTVCNQLINLAYYCRSGRKDTFASCRSAHGRREGDYGRHVRSEIATLNFFVWTVWNLWHSSNFQHIFCVLGALPKTPPGLRAWMDPAGDGTHSFVPLRNKFLATPLGQHCEGKRLRGPVATWYPRVPL